MPARTLLLTCLGAALLGPIGPWQAPAQSARYPGWFRSMPQPEEGLWAVGYAQGYSTLESGIDSAKADAYERLRRDRRVTLEGEKLYESAPGFRQSLEGTSYAETGLPDTLRSVAYLDSAKAGGMTLVLAAWAPEGASPNGLPGGPQSGRAPFRVDPPSWVRDRVEGGAGRTRAVGRAPRYYYLQSSWRRAEKRARRQLAFRAASKVERLEKNAEDWRHGVTALKTNVRLRRVQTLARWADENTCYVLVEGTVGEVLIGK